MNINLQRRVQIVSTDCFKLLSCRTIHRQVCPGHLEETEGEFVQIYLRVVELLSMLFFTIDLSPGERSKSDLDLPLTYIYFRLKLQVQLVLQLLAL